MPHKAGFQPLARTSAEKLIVFFLRADDWSDVPYSLVSSLQTTCAPCNCKHGANYVVLHCESKIRCRIRGPLASARVPSDSEVPPDFCASLIGSSNADVERWKVGVETNSANMPVSELPIVLGSSEMTGKMLTWRRTTYLVLGMRGKARPRSGPPSVARGTHRAAEQISPFEAHCLFILITGTLACPAFLPGQYETCLGSTRASALSTHASHSRRLGWLPLASARRARRGLL